MEVKIANAFPMKLARIFSELGIFPVSFSKYGRAYMDMRGLRGAGYVMKQEQTSYEREVIAYA